MEVGGWDLDASQPENLDVCMAVFDVHPRNAWLKVEPPRPGCPRVHDDPGTPPFDQRLVRVAEHNYIRFVAREQLVWSRCAQLVAVAHMDGRATELQIEALCKTGLTRRIGIAEHSSNGSDCRELDENGLSTDITGVQNELDAGERREHLRTQQSVRIGNQAYEHPS